MRQITQKVVLNNDFELAVSAGLYNDISHVNKFGSSPSTADGEVFEVWDGGVAYTWPTTASITHVRAAVDSVITRGVVVEVQGLDLNWNLVVQDATTNGTTSTVEVALTTPLRRVFRVKVKDDTSTDQAIWVGPTGFATKQAIVQAGNNQTLMAIYTVPAGKTAYVRSYYGDYVRDSVKDPDSISVQFWMRDNTNGYAKQIKHQKGIPKQASGFVHPFTPYYKATEKTDIIITGTPDGAAAHIHAGFDLYLINN